jgi:hypothetical protein
MNVLGNEVALSKKRFVEDLIIGSARIAHHILVVGLSAAFALSLPFTVTFIAKNLLVYWSLIGNERVFLTSIEMALTISLIFFSSYISRSWKDRKLSNMARGAGLVFGTSTRGLFVRRRMKKLKEKEGFARDVMVIGSTGYRTFVDPGGDLHNVIKNCREAKIMFLHPNSEGAGARAKSVLDPDITPESLGEQIKKSIDYLKGLRAAQKNIKLKLYDDMPLLKLTIVGDYIWIQHYHAGFDVQSMPEYVFKHDQNTGSLYIPFYQYFLTRWNNPDIPEYDFDTGELVYRDAAGNEARREKFDESKKGIAPNPDSSNHLIEKSLSPLPRALGNRSNIRNAFTEERQKRLGGLCPRGKEFFLLNSKSPACEIAGWMTIL